MWAHGCCFLFGIRPGVVVACVGMYLRRTQRRRADGSAVGYVQVAHNRRVGGVTRAEVLLNLGREDELDVEGLRRLARSISRYTDGEPGDVADAAGEQLEVVESRPLGGAYVLDALWRRLGVADAIAGAVGVRRFATDVERVLFALVAKRALRPFSKLAAAESASRDVHIPGLGAMDEDQAYRAMDVLAAADVEAGVQEAVFFACADLLNLEVDLLFFDTTSTYFERDEPETGADGTPGFRALGYSKDHRPDRPQIVIGLAVTREGIPVRVWVWPGNTNDQTVIKQAKDDLAGWRLGRVVWVVDRGFSGDESLRYHPSLGRYLRLTPTGRLRIDRAKVAAEQRLDGKFLLSTSDPDISAEDVALGYKNLLEAERSFRDLKGILRLRPVFHRLEERIRAHILICWLALLLIRLCERQANDTWRNLRRELERLHPVTLAGAAGRVQQTTRLTPAQRDILDRLEVE